MIHQKIKFILTLAGFIAGFAAPLVALAAMSSTNYFIFADSVGVNGGILSQSASYSIEDTTGESPVGFTTSTSYEVRGGYQAMERGSLTLTISNNAINLGQLSYTIVSIKETTVSVTSDVVDGYALTIGGVSGTMPTAVADGSVSPGVQEYGFSITGPHAAFSDDRAVVAGQLVASSTSAIANDSVILNFKASRASGDSDSTFSHVVTLTASANF
ncbi:MAG: hypothetical protein Q7K39_00135 [Candidatus Magasanikbacteria bacterium]|nr:hypothetical protein [Candidatus Magasanikbacteria bacterium]